MIDNNGHNSLIGIVLDSTGFDAPRKHVNLGRQDRAAISDWTLQYWTDLRLILRSVRTGSDLEFSE